MGTLLVVMTLMLVLVTRAWWITDDLRRMERPGYYRPVKTSTHQKTNLEGLQRVDGVEVAVGDRVLVNHQDVASDNGIYVVADGVWARSDDMSTDEDIIVGNTVFVQSGSTNGGKTFVLEAVRSDIEGRDGMMYAIHWVDVIHEVLGRSGQSGDVLVADPETPAGVRWEAPVHATSQSASREPVEERRSVEVDAGVRSFDRVPIDAHEHTEDFKLVVKSKGEMSQLVAWKSFKVYRDAQQNLSILQSTGTDDDSVMSVKVDNDDVLIKVCNQSETPYELVIRRTN